MSSAVFRPHPPRAPADLLCSRRLAVSSAARSGRRLPPALRTERLSCVFGQGESVAAVTGWISNLGTTVAQAFDDAVHVSDGDHGGAQAAGGRPAASKSGGAGSNQSARQGQGARQRSELEQQAYELKVSSVPHPVAPNPGVLLPRRRVGSNCAKAAGV
jgi:hypothetical protein